MGREIDLVVNPAAGGGRAGRLVGEMVRELGAVGMSARVHRTGGRAHLAETVRALVAQAVAVIGVMGGDGTFHDACDALLQPDGTVMGSAGSAFALVPAGTGGDLAARTFGMPSAPRDVAAWLARAAPSAMDLGVIEASRPRPGDRATMAFTNIASCGLSGRVDFLVSQGPKWLTGKAAYLVATLRGLAGWRHQPVRVLVDGAVVYEGPALTVAVANGRAFGGGMLIAPQADCADGKLDVVILGDLSLAQITQHFPRIYKGEHLGASGIVVARGAEVRLEPAGSEEVLLDIDGEAAGRLPARVRLIPSAVRVLRA